MTNAAHPSPAPHVLDGRPVVIVVRDPDSSNEYTTYPGIGDPATYDVDLGNIWPEEGVTVSEAWGDQLADLEGHPAHAELLALAVEHWAPDEDADEDDEDETDD